MARATNHHNSDHPHDQVNNDLIVEFLLQVEAAEATRVKYRGHLQEFRRWLAQRQAQASDAPSALLTDVTAADVQRFMAYLRSPDRIGSGRWGGALAPSSRRTFLASLRVFYRFLVTVGVVASDPTAAVRPPRTTLTPGLCLDADELRRLLESPGTPRERIVTYLLVYTAARSGELRNLRWGDVDLVNRTIQLSGKNGKSRHVSIHPRLMTEIRRWFLYQDVQAERNEQLREIRSNPDNDYVLLTRSGKPLSSTGVYKQIKRRAARAGLHVLDPGHREHRSRVSPHALRRSFATLLLNEGHHIDAVADILGHASVDTTRKHYAFASDARRRATMEAFNP